MEEIVINSPFSYHYNVLLTHAKFILCTHTHPRISYMRELALAPQASVWVDITSFCLTTEN